MYLDHEGNRKGDISPSWGQPNTRIQSVITLINYNKYLFAEAFLNFFNWTENLQVRIFVQILGNTHISEHLREWKRKETWIE